MRSEATGPGVQHEGFDVDEKISLLDFTVFGPMYFTQTLRGSSSLNIDGVSKKAIYSESVSKMLQHGIENSNFSNRLFLVLCILTKL